MNAPKRKADSQHEQQQNTKHAKLGDSSLSDWITSAVSSSAQPTDNDQQTTTQWPRFFAVSQEIHDRDSIFVATAASPVTSHRDLLKLQVMVRKGVYGPNITRSLTLGKPSHVMCAARYVGLKPGKTGLRQEKEKLGSKDGGNPIEDDFEIQTVSDDDGEKYGGDRILKTLNSSGALDVGVCVSRWFGGTLLGVVRFKHIEEVAKKALVQLHDMEQKADIDALRQQLQTYDKQISTALYEISRKTNDDGIKADDLVQDYPDLTVHSGSRLLKAREKRLEYLRKRVGSLSDAENSKNAQK